MEEKGHGGEKKAAKTSKVKRRLTRDTWELSRAFGAGAEKQIDVRQGEGRERKHIKQ